MKTLIPILCILAASCGGPNGTGGGTGTTPAGGQGRNPGAGESGDDACASCTGPCIDTHRACIAEIDEAISACERACATDYPDESARLSCNAECGMARGGGSLEDGAADGCARALQECTEGCSEACVGPEGTEPAIAPGDSPGTESPGGTGEPPLRDGSA